MCLENAQCFKAKEGLRDLVLARPDFPEKCWGQLGGGGVVQVVLGREEVGVSELKYLINMKSFSMHCKISR